MDEHPAIRVSTPRQANRQSVNSGAFGGVSPGASAAAGAGSFAGASVNLSQQGSPAGGRTVQGWLDQVQIPDDEPIIIDGAQPPGNASFAGPAPSSFVGLPAEGYLPDPAAADDGDSVLASPLAGKSPEPGKKSKLLRDEETGELRQKTLSEEQAGDSSSSSSSSSDSTSGSSSTSTTGSVTDSGTDSSPNASPDANARELAVRAQKRALRRESAKAQGRLSASSSSSVSSSTSSESTDDAGSPHPPRGPGPSDRRPVSSSSAAVAATGISPASPHLPRPPSSSQQRAGSSHSHSMTEHDQRRTAGSGTGSRPNSHGQPQRGFGTPMSGAEARGLSRGSQPRGTSNPNTPPTGFAPMSASGHSNTAFMPLQAQPTGGTKVRRQQHHRQHHGRGAAEVGSFSADSSDDDSDSTASSSVSETTTSSTATTTTTSVSTATASTGRTASTDIGDDDVLYATLVGLPSASAPMASAEAGGAGREAKLRTMVGNVWRGLRSRSKRSKGAADRVQDEATSELITALLRERHQFRHAAQMERDHRRAAQEKAEEQQKVVDKLIARGLSRGASGSGAIVTSLYGDPDREKREKRARRQNRKTERSANSSRTASSHASPVGDGEKQADAFPAQVADGAKESTEKKEKKEKKAKKSKSEATPVASEAASAKTSTTEKKKKKSSSSSKVRKSGSKDSPSSEVAAATASPSTAMSKTSAQRAPTAPLVLDAAAMAMATGSEDEAPPGATPRPRGRSAGARRALDAQRPAALDLGSVVGTASGYGKASASSPMCAQCAKYGGVGTLLAQISRLKEAAAATASSSAAVALPPVDTSSAHHHGEPGVQDDVRSPTSLVDTVKPPSLPATAAAVDEQPASAIEEFASRTIPAQRRPSETRVEGLPSL